MTERETKHHVKPVHPVSPVSLHFCGDSFLCGCVPGVYPVSSVSICFCVDSSLCGCVPGVNFVNSATSCFCVEPRLCGRCKEHGVTVQAAISAASMLAMARAQARNHPLPQNILTQAPINMRSQAGSFFLFSLFSSPCPLLSASSLSSSSASQYSSQGSQQCMHFEEEGNLHSVST